MGGVMYCLIAGVPSYEAKPSKDEVAKSNFSTSMYKIIRVSIHSSDIIAYEYKHKMN